MKLNVTISPFLNFRAFGDELSPGSSTLVGCIDLRLDAKSVIEKCCDNARAACESVHSAAPEVDVEVVNDVDNTDQFHMVYVPDHLNYVVFEMLKNAMEATVKAHKDSSKEIPKVQITMAKSFSDVTIRIADRGKSFERRKKAKVRFSRFSQRDFPGSLQLRPRVIPLCVCVCI